MADNQRAQRRNHSARKRRSQNNGGICSKLLNWLCTLLLVAIIGVSATYYFGSFETRNKLTANALETINIARTNSETPAPIKSALDDLYDLIPSSEGLIVDGEELGRDDSPILAGIPQSKHAIRLLRNVSYVNLYSEQHGQSLCALFKVKRPSSESTTGSERSPIPDPRIVKQSTSQKPSIEWRLMPIAVPEALEISYGSKGYNEGRLSTNMAPMKAAFAKELWEPLMHLVTVDYAQRFEAIWVYSGPVHSTSTTTAKSPLPEAYYLIAFDLTDSGGLRALSFLVPVTAPTDTPLKDFIVSIDQVEAATKLQFLPEIGFDSKELLESWTSPDLW